MADSMTPSPLGADCRHAIGVSNFYPNVLTNLCECVGVVPEAWAPLGGGRYNPFEDEGFAAISAHHMGCKQPRQALRARLRAHGARQTAGPRLRTVADSVSPQVLRR